MMGDLKIKIPPGLDFSALKLARDTSTGALSFSWEPIERICEHSGIDIAVFRDRHEDNVGELIISWYMHHLANGGATDPVAEDIIAETQAEDDRGGGISHPPGRA